MPAQTEIVLVHGWAGSAESWHPVSKLLREQTDAPVHCFRLPGSPHAQGGRPTIAAATGQLVDLLRSWEVPAVLVGHSLGAQVTLRAHAAVPQLVLTEVVIDPAYGAGADERESMTRWAEQIEAGGHAAIDHFFEAAGAGLSRPDLVRLHADLHATMPEVLASYLRSEYLDPDAVGLLPASARVAASRRQPVLALHSSSDGVDREGGLPSPKGSRTELWQGYGHYLHLQDPQRFAARLTDWVSNLGSETEAR